MTVAPFIPENAPFTAEQRAWLNGFLAGMFSRQQASATAAAPSPTLTPLTIAWGSQTGTSESLAKRLAKEAGKANFAPTIVDLAQLPVDQLNGLERLLVITSTYGDGEPPDNAKSFWETLRAAENLSLTKLRYSVCALGDSNYPLFCQFGKDLDAKLERFGAQRISARADCETDYEEPFSRWVAAALAALGSNTASSGVTAPSNEKADAGTAHGDGAYSKSNPFPSRVRESRNLNGAGSAKSVHHVVFDLGTSGLSYEAGDALGVWPQNCPALVAEVLAFLGFDGEEAVPAVNGGTTSLRQALTSVYDLGKPTAELRARLVRATAGSGEATEPGPHVIDLLQAYPDHGCTAAEFVALLRKMQPRLYSISSSPKAHPGEVHLTVGKVVYDLSGRPRKGVCSTFLADRIVPNETPVGIFVHANKAFRPPANPDAPMIMIGPGTGIAPFRAFLEEREASQSKGKNWLFFGDQRAASDFLYRSQIEGWQASGLLTRLDTAFSRDQSEKIYVQNRMIEAGAELWSWLEAGAHVYVCGDASRMAKDVDRALHEIVEKHGGKDTAAAKAYVDALKSAKRYARDVY